MHASDLTVIYLHTVVFKENAFSALEEVTVEVFAGNSFKMVEFDVRRLHKKAFLGHGGLKNALISVITPERTIVHG